MKRILLIDSDPVTARLSSKFLTNFNYEVEVATTGKIGLDKLNTECYDLVLTDIELIGLGGFDVLKMMNKCFMDVPVFFFTSLDDPTTWIEADSLGAKKLISKRKDYINLPHIIDSFFYSSHDMVA